MLFYLCLRKYVSRVSKRQALSIRTTSSRHSWDMSSHTSIQLPLQERKRKQVSISVWAALRQTEYKKSLSLDRNICFNENTKLLLIWILFLQWVDTHHHENKITEKHLFLLWYSKSKRPAAYLLGVWNGPKWNWMLHLTSLDESPLSLATTTPLSALPSLWFHKDRHQQIANLLPTWSFK